MFSWFAESAKSNLKTKHSCSSRASWKAQRQKPKQKLTFLPSTKLLFVDLNSRTVCFTPRWAYISINTYMSRSATCKLKLYLSGELPKKILIMGWQDSLKWFVRLCAGWRAKAWCLMTVWPNQLKSSLTKYLTLNSSSTTAIWLINKMRNYGSIRTYINQSLVFFLSQILSLPWQPWPSSLEKEVTIFGWEGGAGEDNLIGMVAICQPQGSHALKPTLLYRVFYFKWEPNLQNENHAVLKKTRNYKSRL